MWSTCYLSALLVFDRWLLPIIITSSRGQSCVPPCQGINFWHVFSFHVFWDQPDVCAFLKTSFHHQAAATTELVGKLPFSFSLPMYKVERKNCRVHKLLQQTLIPKYVFLDKTRILILMYLYIHLAKKSIVWHTFFWNACLRTIPVDSVWILTSSCLPACLLSCQPQKSA